MLVIKSLSSYSPCRSAFLIFLNFVSDLWYLFFYLFTYLIVQIIVLCTLKKTVLSKIFFTLKIIDAMELSTANMYKVPSVKKCKSNLHEMTRFRSEGSA